MTENIPTLPEPLGSVVGDGENDPALNTEPVERGLRPPDADIADEAWPWGSTPDKRDDPTADATRPSDEGERPVVAPPQPPSPARPARPTVLMAAGIAGAAAVALIIVVAAPRLQGLLRAPTPARGQLSVLSDAPARVSIDGTDRGETPIEVTLDAGPHAVRVSSGPDSDTMTVVVAAGSREVHHVHAARSTPLAAETGALRITTPEAGARIVLDGEFRGLTPMSFAELTPGVHHVVVVTPGASIRRDVTIEAARTLDLDLMPTAAAATRSSASGGWLVISSPFEVEIWENGALIGSSRTARFMLSPGSHSLDIVNQLLHYRDHQTIAVTAGQTTPLRLVAPQGTLSVNAKPWADVWIDGSRIGETPIGEIPLSIGSHDVLLRHPDLGDRHVQALVRVGDVTRVTQDLRKLDARP